MRLAVLAFLGVLGLSEAARAQGLDVHQREEALKHYRQGEEAMRVETFDEAVREFKAAIDLDPLMVMAHYNLGQSYMALKRYPEAETAYLGCEETFRRRNALGQKERAELDRATDDEIRTLRNDVQRARSSAGGQAGYSVEQYVIRMEDRIRVLQSSKLKGAEVARVPAELYVALGSACLRQNKLEDAERAYTSAVKADKKLGAAHNNLAVVYMLTGRFAEAEEALRRAESAGFHVSPQLKSDLKQRAEAAQR